MDAFEQAAATITDLHLRLLDRQQRELSEMIAHLDRIEAQIRRDFVVRVVIDGEGEHTEAEALGSDVIQEADAPDVYRVGDLVWVRRPGFPPMSNRNTIGRIVAVHDFPITSLTYDVQIGAGTYSYDPDEIRPVADCLARGYSLQSGKAA